VYQATLASRSETFNWKWDTPSIGGASITTTVSPVDAAGQPTISPLSRHVDSLVRKIPIYLRRGAGVRFSSDRSPPSSSGRSGRGCSRIFPVPA
jgi:hypothetical protein